MAAAAFHAAHAGHADIEQSHIGPVLAVQIHGLLAVGSLRDHGHVGLHVDNGGHATRATRWSSATRIRIRSLMAKGPSLPL